MLSDFVKNPKAGPGWPRVGAKGKTPFDIASLGQVGDEQIPGAKVVNKTEVDQVCVLYKDIYDLMEQYVLT